jgi:hypothetical protein
MENNLEQKEKELIVQALENLSKVVQNNTNDIELLKRALINNKRIEEKKS